MISWEQAKTIAIGFAALNLANPGPAAAHPVTSPDHEEPFNAASLDWMENPPMEMNDFDVMEGHWTIQAARLPVRMEGSQDWITFGGSFEVVTLIPGLANADKIMGSRNGEPFRATNIRTFNADTQEWTATWMSDFYPRLTEQTRGNFADGVAVFYGTEDYRGKTYRMRFRWQRQSEDRIYWDQSYQDPDTGDWEINWKMAIVR